MPIFRRLFVLFTFAVFVPIFVIILLGTFYLHSMSVRSQAVQTSFEAQNIATKEQINLQRMNALLQARFAQVVGQGSPALGEDFALGASGELANAEITALEIDFNQTIIGYQGTYEIATSDNMNVIRSILTSDTADHGHQLINAQRNSLNEVIHTDWGIYRTLQDKVLLELGDHLNFATDYADFFQANQAFLHLKIHWQEVVDTATQMGTAVTQVGPSLISPLLMYTTGALLFTLLVIIAAGFLVNLTIVKPLSLLVSLTRRISQGETYARADIRGSDEIYQVAASINNMLDIIVRLIQESQSRHAELQAHIEKLIHEVSGVGKGDLRTQAAVDSNELAPLASSFNSMTEQLSTLVINVKLLSHGVQSVTLQVFGYIEQLVDNIDAQTQQVSAATLEVDTMAASSRQLAERSNLLFGMASNARQAAQSGRRAVQQTSKGMEHINNNIRTTSTRVMSLGQHSREISNIVETISNIAQQTNRLALDATIQASMAGENGKGFAAIAVDIRRLAELVREQTNMIGRLVHDVLDDINTATTTIKETEQDAAAGMQFTSQVGKSLEAIFAVVEQQSSEIEVANQVVAQQLQSSTMVVQIMHSVFKAGQESAVSTREATRQVERLAHLAGQLLTSVEAFKLWEDQGQSAPASGITSGTAHGKQPGYPGQGTPTKFMRGVKGTSSRSSPDVSRHGSSSRPLQYRDRP
ncbi:MAG: methyl-accepting chemotaxis protein [Ktedonobacteraceae bacterium]|nr:methyl-accepting chemotaxis protein [Ktedonobacteraceae bacterium]